MFDAFKIGVSVHLKNHARLGLHSLSGSFRKASGEATRLTRQIETLKLMMGAGLVSNTKGQAQLALLNTQLAAATANAAALGQHMRGLKSGLAIGAATAGAGILGLGVLGGVLRGGEGYQEAKNQARMINLTHEEMADAVATAWANTGKIITATAAEGVADLVEMKAVLGDLDIAKGILPTVSKLHAIGAALKWRGAGNTEGLARDMAKALDMLGKTKTASQFEESANKLGQAMIWSKGMVNAESYRFLGKYSRQAKYGFSDEFLFNLMPKLIVDYASKRGGGGGHGGVGAPLAAFFRFVVQGQMNKESAKGLVSLGLIPRAALMKTTTTGTTVSTGMIGKGRALENPFDYTHDYIVPAIMKRHAKGRKFDDISPQEWTEWVGTYFRGNQPAAGLILDFIVQKDMFHRDARNTAKALRIHDAFEQAIQGSPAVAKMAISAQWENLQASLANNVWPHLIRVGLQLSGAFGSLARTLHEYPALTSAIVWGFGALATALAGFGILATVGVGFQLIGSAFAGGTLAAGVGAIATAFGLPVWGTLAVIAGGLTALASAFGLFSWLSAWANDPDRQNRVPTPQVSRPPHSSAVVMPPGPKATPTPSPIVVNMQMDGRVVGRGVAQHVADDLDGPSVDSSTFDPSMNVPATGQIGAP